jgi:anti-sigma regulatory factor (Ser/Thr protein kinase)
MHNVDDAAFGRLILHLHVEEVISAGDGFVDMSVTSRIVSDYVDARSRILSAPEKRAAIVGQTMQLNLARAPRLMSEFYRSNAAIGVRRLLDGLRGQTVPRAAIDYRPFKTNHKGQEDAATLSALRSATDTIDLPYVVYTANAAAFYPPLREIGDRDRSAIGLTETGEAWIVAEIDSKLEADAALTEFWCDRLEMAAVNCGLDRFRIWLIAPEGFADESLDILDTRRAYGSSKKQIEFLGQVLSSPREPEPDEQTSYEIVVPMGDEGEIVATRTLADVAARHGIPDKTLAQCKTALIEAMINAGEHSLSPDRRIELGFVVTGQALTIVITNRGLRLTDRMPSGEVLDEARRGWGLQLMQKLMDDVRVEPTDDGTRLVMTKHFRNNDVDAVL